MCGPGWVSGRRGSHCCSGGALPAPPCASDTGATLRDPLALPPPCLTIHIPRAESDKRKRPLPGGGASDAFQSLVGWAQGGQISPGAAAAPARSQRCPPQPPGQVMAAWAPCKDDVEQSPR